MKIYKRSLLLLLSVILLLPAVSLGETSSGPDGTVPCTFIAPEEVQSYTSHLSDGDPDTTVTLRTGETLTMQLSGTPSGLYFDFYTFPGTFLLTYLDAEGTILGQERFRSAEHLVFIPAAYETLSAVSLTVENGDVRISEWLACTDAFPLPFPDTDKRADVLVVLNEPGDELALLGGLLAMLSGEHGLSTQVVYLTQADGYVTHQCMDILRKEGVLRAPVFGRGKPYPNRAETGTLNALGGEDAIIRSVAAAIRTLQPKILITLDTSDEQERYADGVIARTVLTAANYAANPARDPETEAFTIPKVYTLSSDGETTVSLDVPLYAYDGITANELARSLYRIYIEKRVFRKALPETLRFSLVSESVGADSSRDDLLEHLSVSDFPHYRVPTPTPEPTPLPTPKPTERAAAATANTQAAESLAPSEPAKDAAGNHGAASPNWLFAVIGAAAGATMWFALRKLNGKRRALFAVLPVLLGVVLTFALPSCASKPASDPKDAAKATVALAPTNAPTPEPTEAPTPEPTEAPTASPTPDPNDAYFLDGDGEAYELDFENGHWWYKNAVLAIDVKEVHTTFEDAGPLVYYVADIRMRDYSSYRSGVHTAYLTPWRFAREDRAVLAITGDCLSNEKEYKGCLIRRGVYYANHCHADALIIEDDGMSMRVERALEISPRVLMDHGVRDTYSFGPILVENGEVYGMIDQTRVSHVNPRAGIGMVEPGHWIAIATDGRQNGYSMSISLEFFAKLFLEYDCTVAFNMDGGSSVAIAFMGELLNKHYARGTPDTQRPWIDALEFGYSEQVPSPDVPTVHDGLQHPAP